MRTNFTFITSSFTPLLLEVIITRECERSDGKMDYCGCGRRATMGSMCRKLEVLEGAMSDVHKGDSGVQLHTGKGVVILQHFTQV